MLRRVPEYQWRGMDVKDSLTKEQAREYLIFQMTQVLAAPLVAIATYYVLEPSSQKSSIALSFASGLASHPILLAIRAVTDTLTPTKLGIPPVDLSLNSSGTREGANVTKERQKIGE